MMSPLAAALSEHIWFTVTSRGGTGPVIICKCTLKMANSESHAEHVAEIARDFLASA